jgi:hypothetical protein
MNIMKLRHVALMLAVLALVFASCQQSETDEVLKEVRDGVVHQQGSNKNQPLNSNRSRTQNTTEFPEINPTNNPCDHDEKNLRILFIGNSFTANYSTDIPQMFLDLATHNGQSISTVASRAALGFTLANHLK